jgi:hypothetical protein
VSCSQTRWMPGLIASTRSSEADPGTRPCEKYRTGSRLSPPANERFTGTPGEAARSSRVRNRGLPRGTSRTSLTVVSSVSSANLTAQPINLPKVIAHSHRSFYAHLPNIGWNESDTSRPLFLQEKQGLNGDNVVEGPALKPTAPTTDTPLQNLSYYEAAPNNLPVRLWWASATLDTTEQFAPADSLVTNSTLDVQPANGVFEEPFYTWNETGPIDPTIIGTPNSVAASRIEWDFLSGIALGIAGTGVAFVQERDNPLLSRAGSVVAGVGRWIRARFWVG